MNEEFVKKHQNTSLDEAKQLLKRAILTFWRCLKLLQMKSYSQKHIHLDWNIYTWKLLCFCNVQSL
ncbi:hypothetical protein GQR36_00125 [Enterococcus termitis]